MKLFLICIFTLMAQSCFAQPLKLNYYCSDVKIISEYTGDTISRCELGFNRQEDLARLGGNNYFYDERMEDELRDLYHYGDDIFHYAHDTLIKRVGFDIFTDKFKLLIDNQFLVKVGNHIDSCFKQYAPIPLRNDRGIESAIIVYYKSQKKEEDIIERSFLYIRFNKISKIVTHIGDVSKPGI